LISMAGTFVQFKTHVRGTGMHMHHVHTFKCICVWCVHPYGVFFKDVTSYVVE
jgi:hypothetical protein